MSVFDLNVILDKWAQGALALDEDGEVLHEVDTSKLRIVATSMTPTPDVKQNEQSSMVVKSKYVNKTDATQEHTFIVERKTEATVTTQLTKGFSFGGKVGIRIEVPEDNQRMNGAFGNDVTIETEDENVLKETLGWSVNSKVIAPRKTTTVAILTIQEKVSKFTFTGTVTLKGRVIAKEVGGRGRVTFGDLATILEPYKQGLPSGATVDLNTRKVTWKVAGSLNFRYGVSQDVEVAYE